MAATGPVVGIDLGGTNTLACVLLPDGTVAGRSHRPTDAARGTAAVIDGLAEAAHAAWRVVSKLPAPPSPARCARALRQAT